MWPRRLSSPRPRPKYDGSSDAPGALCDPVTITELTCCGHAPFLCSSKDHRTAALRVCFHALQLTKRIERTNRNQFEAHEVGLSQR